MVQRLAQQHAGGELRHLAVLVSEVGGNAVNPNKKKTAVSPFSLAFFVGVYVGLWFMVNSFDGFMDVYACLW